MDSPTFYTITIRLNNRSHAKYQLWAFPLFHSDSYMYVKKQQNAAKSKESLCLLPNCRTIIMLHCFQTGCFFHLKLVSFYSLLNLYAYIDLPLNSSNLHFSPEYYFSSMMYVPVFISVVYILHVWNKCYHAWSKFCLFMIMFMRTLCVSCVWSLAPCSRDNRFTVTKQIVLFTLLTDICYLASVPDREAGQVFLFAIWT